MPNWCSNQLVVHGEKDLIQDFVSSLNPIYGLQQRSALRLLLCHCWYHLISQTDDMTEESAVMDIYDRILDITNKGELSRDVCQEVLQMFLAQKLTVENVGEDKVDSRTKEDLLRICRKVKGDFLGWGTGDEDDLWNQMLIKANERIEESAQLCFDFGNYLPPEAGAMVNGFNGRFFDALREVIGDRVTEDLPAGRGYSSNNQRWGTKWNACDVEITVNAKGVIIDFDTAWSPPEPVIEAIINRYNSLNVVHIYAEQGMDYCGVSMAEKGQEKFNEHGTLEWSEVEDEDEHPDVIGPKYVLNLRHFGG